MKKIPFAGLLLAGLACIAAPALAQAPASVSAQAPAPATAPSPAPAQPQAAAPAASGEALPDWLQYKNPYVGEQNSITHAHRANPEIIAWAQEKATDIMTLSPGDYVGKMGVAKALFAPSGWNNYSAYLQSAKIPELVQQRRYSMRMIADGEARMINQGNVQGAYRWLLDMPVIIAFEQTDDAGVNQPRGGGKFKLQLQLVRTENKATQDGIAIEAWKVSAP